MVNHWRRCWSVLFLFMDRVNFEIMKNENLNKLTEFFSNIMGNPNIEQRRTGLSNLLNRVLEIVSDIVEVEDCPVSKLDVRYRDYLNEIYNFFAGDTSDILYFIENHIQDISVYEKDSAEAIEIRRQKLKEYSQVTYIQPKVKRIIRPMTGLLRIDKVEYEEEPDQIYTQNGSYRKFCKYKDSPKYVLYLFIRRCNLSLKDRDFELACKFVSLYYSIRFELELVEEEMEMLGLLDRNKENGDAIKDLLSNKTIKKILNKAQKFGLVSHKDGKYEWKGNNLQYIEFAEYALSMKVTNRKWTDWELLFGKKNSAQIKGSYKGSLSELSKVEKQQIHSLFS